MLGPTRRPLAPSALATLLMAALTACNILPGPDSAGGGSVVASAGDVATSMLMDQDRNKLFDQLDAELRSLPPDAPVPVIVLTDHPVGEEDLTRAAGGPVEPKHIYNLLPGFAADLTTDQLQRLAKQPWVRQIEPDEPVYLLLDTAVGHSGATKARTDFGVDGDGDGTPSRYTTGDVVVAVIDTGIDPGHADLANKVIGWSDWVNGRPTPYDDHGHGTHVAGIAAGAGAADARYPGVAPGAALVGLKVLDARGSGSLSNVAAAVEWCVENKATFHIRVIKMTHAQVTLL